MSHRQVRLESSNTWSIDLRLTSSLRIAGRDDLQLVKALSRDPKIYALSYSNVNRLIDLLHELPSDSRNFSIALPCVHPKAASFHSLSMITIHHSLWNELIDGLAEYFQS